MFNGIEMSPGNLSRISDAKTLSVSAENLSGGASMGARTVPEGGPARELGVGWKVSPCVSIPGKTERTIAEIDGPGAIQSMWFAGYIAYDIVIRIYWEDQTVPSVEAPLPAFFAHAYYSEENCNGRYPTLDSALVMVAPKKGLSCFFSMPFRKKCRVTLESITDNARDIFFQINYALSDIPEDCAYFHAQYRQRRPVGYMEEYTVLDGISGRGHYIGTALAAGLNGAHGWWGEGEIKFYIDGDKEFPTICGTGVEDYFLGAWGWESEGRFVPYSGMYAGMYQVQRSTEVYSSQERFQLYRWHLPDPVRFETGLRVTLQDLGWRSGGRYHPRRDDFITVAYWYQTLPTAPFPKLPSADELEII